MTLPAPRTVHLASQVLPGGGLFTNQAFFDLPYGAETLIYWVTYTRGAAGGYPKVQVQWGNGTEQSSELLLDKSSLDVTDPIGSVNLYVEQPLLPAPNSDSPLPMILELDIPAGATEARLIVAEAGQVATPGTILVAYTVGVGPP